MAQPPRNEGTLPAITQLGAPWPHCPSQGRRRSLPAADGCSGEALVGEQHRTPGTARLSTAAARSLKALPAGVVRRGAHAHDVQPWVLDGWPIAAPVGA